LDLSDQAPDQIPVAVSGRDRRRAQGGIADRLGDQAEVYALQLGFRPRVQALVCGRVPSWNSVRLRR
jgi:hypothetical protein